MQFLNCIWQAHLHFSQPFFDRNRMFDACFISTGTAIELIFFCYFAHRDKDVVHIFFLGKNEFLFLRFVTDRKIQISILIK